MLRRPRLASLVIPVAILTGCAGPAPVVPAAPGATTTTPQTLGGMLVDGFVEAGLPLEGATLSVLGLDGRVIATAPVTDGHFALGLAEAPRDFRVVVKGGALGGEPFEGELAAEVRGHEDATGTLVVDWVTSLTSRYMQAHPEASPAAAAQAVRTYLALPADGEPDRLHFDAAAFLRAAEGAGGPDAFLTQLASDVGSGGTRPFAPEGSLLQAPLALPVAQFIATNLASGAVSAVGGYGMNQLLGAIGLGDGGQMKAILQKLDQLQTEVTRIQNQLASLKDLMLGLAANTDFQAKQQTLNQQITIIHTLDREYRSLAMLAARGDAKLIEGKQRDIKKYLVDRVPFPMEALQVWRDELVGHGGASEGLIRMWHRVVTTKYPKYYHADIARLSHDQWAYWDAYQARLVLYLSAAVEAGVYSGVDQGELLAFWQENRKAQLGLLRGMPADMKTDKLDLSRFSLPAMTTTVATIPPNVVIDTRNKLMFADRVSVRATPSQYNANAKKAADIPDRETGLHGWRIPTVAEFKAFKTLDGASVRFKDMGFAGNLDAHSYTFWTSDQRRDPRAFLHLAHYMQVWHSDFREVVGIWDRNPSEIHTDTWRAGIALLPVRTVPDAELARYVYPLR